MEKLMADPLPRRPLPTLTDLNRSFWTGGRLGALLIQRCAACAHWNHPPRHACPRCYGAELDYVAVSGAGTVAGYTVNRHPWRPELTDPYTIALVELDEQKALRLPTNIFGIPPGDVHVGLRVVVRFVKQDEFYIPVFVPE